MAFRRTGKPFATCSRPHPSLSPSEGIRRSIAADSLWKMHGKRQVIYAKAELSPREARR
jgi:hypothetical protein